MSLLSVTGLSVRAGGATPVRDISFEVAPGERVGVIGESGSGKSLTALAVLGLLPQALSASGSIRLDDREVVGTRDADLRALRGPVAQIVFQEPLTALDPLMRVGNQIAEPLRRWRGLRGTPLREAVAAALAEVALPDTRIARAYPHELSGGQRQRIAIAIALAAQPRLLIADEPTTALDVTVQDGVLALLERLVAERGMALLFVSHDLAVIARMAERVIVLRQGSVIEQGTVSAVLTEPAHPYTAQLIGSARILDAALDAGARDGGGAR